MASMKCLKSLISSIHEICVMDMELPKDQRNPIFQQFYKTLVTGVDLVKKYENISTFNMLAKFRYACKLLKLQEDINNFLRLMPAHILLDARKLVTELKNAYVELQPAEIRGRLNEYIFKQSSKLTNDPSQNSMMLQQMASDDLFGSSDMVDELPCLYHNFDYGKSQFYVGLKRSIGHSKEFLLERNVSVLGMQCMGGGGKTTLALALCNDPQIRGHFEDRVFLFTVSQSPNLKGILEMMWEKIVGRKRPESQNVEDAHRQLQQQLLTLSEPTLVVLDDVWSRADLEKLLFEAPGYKTLVTSRDSSTIPRNPYTVLYQLSLLGQDDALSLFCFWAFGQTSIPSTADADLVKEVQAECKGLPLALKVIGSSLHGVSRVAWENAKNKLSKGEPISDYHKEGLLRCLETSIDCLDGEARECFLDLGIFPENRKICADALLDIWVSVRKMEWQDAFVVLLELASRNLLSLTSNLGNQAAISYGCASEIYFSQHDAMRDLALYLGCRDSIAQRRRLIMPREENGLPRKWELLNDRASDAQIVSIHTGPMDETQWFEINFPEAEALAVFFDANEYFLPPFLSSMKKLKYVMIFNYGCKRATLKGLDCLASNTQLKIIRLERLIAPLLIRHRMALQNLEKLSLSLCEGFANMSAFNYVTLSHKLLVLKDFNLNHCSDLEELPSYFFHMPSAQTWSITNCHQVEKLPYDLGNLSSVRMLRLSALPSLKELPPSIGKLEQLEYLDISQCECLRELPEEIGKLKKLKEIDMRECSSLRKLPRSIYGLTSLKHVICDEKIGNEWLRVKDFCIRGLSVEIVEAQFSLDWLDD